MLRPQRSSQNLDDFQRDVSDSFVFSLSKRFRNSALVIEARRNKVVSKNYCITSIGALEVFTYSPMRT